MSEWQPIETAPDNESAFLAFDSDGCMAVCRRIKDYIYVAWDATAFHDATHWMPLPAEPEDD